MSLFPNIQRLLDTPPPYASIYPELKKFETNSSISIESTSQGSSAEETIGSTSGDSEEFETNSSISIKSTSQGSSAEETNESIEETIGSTSGDSEETENLTHSSDKTSPPLSSGRTPPPLPPRPIPTQPTKRKEEVVSISQPQNKSDSPTLYPSFNGISTYPVEPVPPPFFFASQLEATYKQTEILVEQFPEVSKFPDVQTFESLGVTLTAYQNMIPDVLKKRKVNSSTAAGLEFEAELRRQLISKAISSFNIHLESRFHQGSLTPDEIQKSVDLINNFLAILGYIHSPTYAPITQLIKSSIINSYFTPTLEDALKQVDEKAAQSKEQIRNNPPMKRKWLMGKLVVNEPLLNQMLGQVEARLNRQKSALRFAAKLIQDEKGKIPTAPPWTEEDFAPQKPEPMPLPPPPEFRPLNSEMGAPMHVVEPLSSPTIAEKIPSLLEDFALEKPAQMPLADPSGVRAPNLEMGAPEFSRTAAKEHRLSSYVNLAFSRQLKGDPIGGWKMLPPLVKRDVLCHIEHSIGGSVESAIQNLFNQMNEGSTLRHEMWKKIEGATYPYPAHLNPSDQEKGERVLKLYYSGKFIECKPELNALLHLDKFQSHLREQAIHAGISLPVSCWTTPEMLPHAIQALERYLHT